MSERHQKKKTNSSWSFSFAIKHSHYMLKSLNTFTVKLTDVNISSIINSNKYKRGWSNENADGKENS
ncbi:MAG: hypothetical protein E7373_01630 [Clostridiales bacterium]|nr:hypothetical protein [Clostridiales bacterium]